MKSWAAWALAFFSGLVGGVLVVIDHSLGAVMVASAAAFLVATVLQRHAGHLALARVAAERDELLARTSHALCTPLTSVVSAIELVLAGHAVTTREVREFLGEARRAATQMARLVNAGLDVAAPRPPTCSNRVIGSG